MFGKGGPRVGWMLGCVIVACAPVFAAQEMRMTNELEITSNSVSGAGANQSNLTQNGRYTNTLGLNQNTEEEKTKVTFNFGGRATNDSRVDFRVLNVNQLQFRITRGSRVLNLGDTFESFSQYTVSSSVKGFSYKMSSNTERAPETTLLYGIAYPRWDSFYGGAESKSIRRTAYGARFKQNYSSVLTGGINLGITRDGSRVNATDPLYDGKVYGFDWEYKPFEGVSLVGESAFASATESPTQGAADVSLSGSAHRLSFVGDGDTFRLGLDYERVSPNFTSLLGSASNDREKLKARWRQRNGKNTTVTYGFLAYRDNLSGQKAYRTTSLKPEVSWGLRRLLRRQYASADVSLKLEKQSGGGSRTINRYLDLNYRDRFGELDADTNAGYVAYDTSGGVRVSHEYTVNTMLSKRRTSGKYVLKPSIYLGTWNAADELAFSRERVYEMSVGLGADRPDSNISSSIKIGKHKLIRDRADDTGRMFANVSVYLTPRSGGQAGNRTFFLRWGLNDYDNTNAALRFRENSLASGMNMQF